MAPHTINFMTNPAGQPGSQNSPSFSPPEPQVLPKPAKRRRLIALFLLLTTIIGLSGLWYTQRPTSADQVRAKVTLEPKRPKNILQKISYLAFNATDDSGSALAGAAEDRVNVLLLGMGGVGHDGPYLTDTIMIASIKPSTKEIALISIPRDLGVSIPGYGLQKINHANAYGEAKKPDWGAATATEVVSKNFNIDIPYYIRLDFKAFEEIINELGGVKVTVDKTFTDAEFPAAHEEYKSVSFTAGEQTMDGETALTFARSRHGNNGEGSDFARARRQQKILAALKEQITDISVLANPIKVTSILNDLENHLTTNMEFDELVSLAKLAKSTDTNNTKSLVLDSSVNGFLRNYFSEGGAFMLTPKTGNFLAINSAINTVFSTSTTSLGNIAITSENTSENKTVTLIPKNSKTPASPNIEI
ncbi:MAG: LCP family protein, partial [Candidatus Magasanikbacteria bacterium]|nr:LCP family protein [Candidatus Magasanikbacteria bacterium]